MYFYTVLAVRVPLVQLLMETFVINANITVHYNNPVSVQREKVGEFRSSSTGCENIMMTKNNINNDSCILKACLKKIKCRCSLFYA